jgi:hypothetical protein
MIVPSFGVTHPATALSSTTTFLVNVGIVLSTPTDSRILFAKRTALLRADCVIFRRLIIRPFTSDSHFSRYQPIVPALLSIFFDVDT